MHAYDLPRSIHFIQKSKETLINIQHLLKKKNLNKQ